VGLDISQIAHGGGVGVYTQKLAEELIKIPDLQTVFFYSSLRKPYTGNLPNVKNFKIPPTVLEILFNKMRIIPMEKFIGKVDIFHSSDWTQPKSRAKKVTTYHDLVALKFPEWSHPKIVEVHKNRLKLVEKEIDMVIAVSDATKKDLMDISRIPAEKIRVVYEGVGEEFKQKSSSDVEEFRRKYNLSKDFILAIGGVGKRRNLEKVKEAAENYNLVITGENIPRIPAEEMPLLYNAAEVLLYPSFYEGFGLPILEAMACGTPVITSNISSMPEVGGEAPEYVNPEKAEEIKKAVDRVIGDKGLREEMIKRGLQQAKKFSWEKCAQETVKVYKEMLSV